MVHEQMRWYWRPNGSDIAAPFKYLGALGMPLAQPSSGLAIRWRDGERYQVTVDDLARAYACDDEPLNTQLWLDDDTDVFVTVESLTAEIVAFEFDCDGLTWQEAARLMANLLAMTVVVAGSLGLVGQPHLEEVVSEWDGYFTEVRNVEPDVPDLIVEKVSGHTGWQVRIREGSGLVNLD